MHKNINTAAFNALIVTDNDLALYNKIAYVRYSHIKNIIQTLPLLQNMQISRKS